MNPYNPYYLRELMADRERQIAKVMLSNEIRRARQETAPSTRLGRVWRPAQAIALLFGQLGLGSRAGRFSHTNRA